MSCPNSLIDIDSKDIIEISITKCMETSSGPIEYYRLCLYKQYNYYFYNMTCVIDFIDKFKRQRELLFRRKCKIEITYDEYYEPLWPKDYINKRVELNLDKFDLDTLRKTFD